MITTEFDHQLLFVNLNSTLSYEYTVQGNYHIFTRKNNAGLDNVSLFWERGLSSGCLFKNKLMGASRLIPLHEVQNKFKCFIKGLTMTTSLNGILFEYEKEYVQVAMPGISKDFGVQSLIQLAEDLEPLCFLDTPPLDVCRALKAVYTKQPLHYREKMLFCPTYVYLHVSLLEKVCLLIQKPPSIF